jgi:hypothetical protein
MAALSARALVRQCGIPNPASENNVASRRFSADRGESTEASRLWDALTAALKSAETVPRPNRETLGGALEPPGAGLVRKVCCRGADPQLELFLLAQALVASH